MRKRAGVLGQSADNMALTRFAPPLNDDRSITGGNSDPQRMTPSELNEYFRKMFGDPSGPNVLDSAALQRNLQPDDLLGPYMGRNMEAVSDALTAAVLAMQAHIISVLIPTLPADRLVFTMRQGGHNNVPFTRVAALGVPREVTFHETETQYTVVPKKQNAFIEKNTLLHRTRGPMVWQRSLQALASNAMLTLMLDALNQLVERAFYNKFLQRSSGQLDQNALFMVESETIGIVNQGDQIFYRALTRNQGDRLAAEFDTVGLPEGTSAVLSHMGSEGRTVLAPNANPAGGDGSRGDSLRTRRNGQENFRTHDHRSIRTIQVGSRTIDVFEIGSTTIEANGRTTLHNPMLQTLVYGEVIPMRAISSSDGISGERSDSLDVFAYSQTATSGRETRINFSEGMRHSFLYDRETGEPSTYYRGFVEQLNLDRAGNQQKFTPRSWTNGNAPDINIEEPFGVAQFDARMTRDRRNLIEMAGWREFPPHVVYDPLQQRWRIPEYVGDIHLSQYSNEYNYRNARLVAQAMEMSPGQMVVAYQRITSLVDSIQRQRWDERYARELIATNLPRLVPAGTILPDVVKRWARDNVPQWTPNDFGALNLPRLDSDGAPFAQTFPPGFASWPGVQTLALEADRPDSTWYQAGLRAREVVDIVEQIYTVLANYVSESELIDSRNTAPWFHVNDDGRSVLFDTMVQLKTGEARPAPIFLRVFTGEVDQPIPEPVLEPDAPSPVAPARRTQPFTFADVAGADQLRELALQGQPLNEWLMLGAHIVPDAFESLRVLSNYVNTVGAMGNLTLDLQGQQTTVDGTQLAASLRKLIVPAIAALPVAANTPFIAQLVGIVENITAQSTESDIGQSIINIQQAAQAARAANPASQSRGRGRGRGDASSLPIFTQAEYEAAINRPEPSIEQVTERSETVREALEEDIGAEAIFIRAPLVRSSEFDAFVNTPTGAALARNALGPRFTQPAPIGATTTTPTTGSRPVRQPPGGAPFLPTAQFGQRGFVNVHELPFILNASLGRSVAPTPARTTRTVPTSRPSQTSRADASSLLQESFRSTLYGDRADVQRAASIFRDVRTGEDSAAEIGIEEIFPSEQLERSMFGPWRARMQWISSNIPNGIERTIALAILLSKNNLQTHLSLARVGANVFRLDYARMGITVDTGAVIRMRRGASTAFTALSNISVVPSLEGVAGAVNVTAEFFSGVVWPDPSAVDILPHAVILGLRGGKTDDFITSIEQLDLPADESPGLLPLVGSVEVTKQAHPISLNNGNFYYRSDINAPSPYRKFQSAGWAGYLLGDRMDSYDTTESQAGVWTKRHRTLILNRAPTTYFNPATQQFDIREPGTGGAGSFEMNSGDAWKTWAGRTLRFPYAPPTYTVL